MAEFVIQFVDVPDPMEADIRDALNRLDLPEDCVEEYSFIVQYRHGSYWLGFETDGRKGIPARSDLSTAAEIAAAMRHLSQCW